MSLLLDDTFRITALDAGRYERVARITGTSSTLNLNLTLDVNTELYPLKVNEQISLALASSLSLTSYDASAASARGNGMVIEIEGGDGAKAAAGMYTDLKKSQRAPDLSDEYDYVCHGRVYKLEEGQDRTATLFISYGGLLMAIAGSYQHLRKILVGEQVYLLLRK